MKSSEYLKNIGFESFKQFQKIAKTPGVTLHLWFNKRVHLFKMVAAGALVTLKSSHNNPALVRGLEVFKTEDYHEDLGNVTFLHFHDFESPCLMYCGSAFDSDFEPAFWTHYVTGIDFNYIYDEAEKL